METDKQRSATDPPTVTTRAVEPTAQDTLDEKATEILKTIHGEHRRQVWNLIKWVGRGMLSLEDIADSYQDGLAAIAHFVLKCPDKATLILESDGVSTFGFCFFKRAAAKRMRRRSKKLKQAQLPQPADAGYTWEDTIADRPTVIRICPTGPWKVEDRNGNTVEREMPTTVTPEHQDLIDTLRQAFETAGLTVLERKVFTTFLERGAELNKRDRYGPLAEFVNERYDLHVTPDQVEAEWESGLRKIRRTAAGRRLARDWGDIGVPRNGRRHRPSAGSATSA